MVAKSRILNRVVTGLVLFMLVFMSVSPGLSAPVVQVFDLGTDIQGFSCHNSLAIGINAAGQVAGYMECDGPIDTQNTIPVLWNNNRIAQTLGDSNLRGVASSVNDQGWVTGSMYPVPSEGMKFNGFLWKPGSPLIEFTEKTDGRVQPTKVNNSGMVVGIYNYSFIDWQGNDRAFTWTEATGLFPIPGFENVTSAAFDVNEAGQVLIRSANGNFQYAFLYNSVTKVLITIPAGNYVMANGMNDAGQVVGVGDYPFVWSAKDGIKDLTSVLGPNANPADIDNNGVISGDYENSDGSQHAFIWSPNIGFVDLGLPTDARGCYPIRSNNYGGVVGYCYGNTYYQHGVLWNVVLTLPKPAQQITQITATVSNLQSSGNLGAGGAAVLTTTLNAVQKQVASGHNAAARALLDLFKIEVRALVATHRLNQAAGQVLIDAANAVIAQLR